MEWNFDRTYLALLPQEDANATLTLTLGQTNFCRKNGFDVQSPLCAHTIMSGTVIKVRAPPVPLKPHPVTIKDAPRGRGAG